MTERMPDGTAVISTGPEQAPVVVLIHGLGLNKDCWQWAVPDLLAAGFRVIVYDLYGHGDSAPPPAQPSLTLFSSQLCAVLDRFRCDQAAIVGFSLGGMIARRFAQDHPDRTAALAILFSPHRRSEQAQQAILERVELARDTGPGATVEAALERWFTTAHRTANPDLMDLVRAWVLANDTAIYHHIYRVLADGVDEIVAPDPALGCPVLVMTGDEDHGNGPEMARAIAAETPGAELHILKGLKHMALAEDPPSVNAPLTAFLRRVLKGTTAK